MGNVEENVGAKKILIILILVIPVIAVVGMIIFRAKRVVTVAEERLSESPKLPASSSLAGHRLSNIEVVKEYVDLERGLGGRRSMDKDSAMLFVFANQDL